MRERGEDDLDITFVGMGIVLMHAVKMIQEALEKVKTLEHTTWLWIFMPWKVSLLVCCVVPCRAVSYCVVLCRAVPCYVVLCLAVSCCVVLCRAVSCCVVLCRVVLCRVLPLLCFVFC